MTTRFTRYLLRTTDVDAAIAFYEAVVGGRGDGVVPLPEPAIARGARPHWLGQIGVGMLGGMEAMAARFVARGATRLGPPAGSADFVVLRDPGGAVAALTDRAAASSASVVWHQLNTREAAKSAETYTDMFGWSLGPSLELGQLGQHRRFAFGEGLSSVGSFSDVEGRPEVHAHWLFFFGVRSLNASLDLVKKLGGVVLGPVALPNGVRVAVCDDPQGAAFGLVQEDEVARLAND